MNSDRDPETSCDISELQEIIKEFLSNYRYLHEFRIQKLIYFAELYTIDNYERRLSDATWKPYMYGSFSEDVRTALKHLEQRDEVNTETVRHNGGETTKYLGHGISGGQLSTEKRQIINRVHQLFKSKSNDELGDESKSSWLYENEVFDEPMDFNRYLNYIQSMPGGSREYYDAEAPDLNENQKNSLVQVSAVVNPDAEATTAD